MFSIYTAHVEAPVLLCLAFTAYYVMVMVVIIGMTLWPGVWLMSWEGGITVSGSRGFAQII